MTAIFLRRKNDVSFGHSTRRGGSKEITWTYSNTCATKFWFFFVSITDKSGLSFIWSHLLRGRDNMVIVCIRLFIRTVATFKVDFKSTVKKKIITIGPPLVKLMSTMNFWGKLRTAMCCTNYEVRILHSSRRVPFDPVYLSCNPNNSGSSQITKDLSHHILKISPDLR